MEPPSSVVDVVAVSCTVTVSASSVMVVCTGVLSATRCSSAPVVPALASLMDSMWLLMLSASRNTSSRFTATGSETPEALPAAMVITSPLASVTVMSLRVVTGLPAASTRLAV